MSKLYRSLLWSGLVVAGVAACGDDVTVTPPPPPPPATVHSVSVAPTGITIGVGGTVQMVATVSADATIATTVTWSSGAPAVASVGATTGLVTGLTNGPVAITACSTVVTTVCGSATLTVNAASATVTDVQVTPSSAPMSIGQTLTASAAVHGANNPAQTVTWTSLAPAVASVGSTTGVITALTSGTAVITACSTLAGFTGVCGSMSVNIAVVSPASVSVNNVNWVQPAPITSCTQGAGNSVPVILTNVRCQIEVTVQVNSGDQQLSRVDVSIGSQVLASQSFATGPSGPELSPISSDITLSMNTQQVRKVSGVLLPVVFNGNQTITAQLYVVGSSTPIASNSIPVIMNNTDALVVLGTTQSIAAATFIPVSGTPTFTDGASNVWFTGSSTFAGADYIAFSKQTPTAVPFTTSVCGPSDNGLSTIGGTPTTGLTVSDVFTCGTAPSGFEGQLVINGFTPPALPYAGGAVNGPDGTAITPPTQLSNTGGGFQAPLFGQATGTETRWNLITPAVPTQTLATIFIDNAAPAITLSLPVAFNPNWDQPWINATTYNLLNNISADDNTVLDFSGNPSTGTGVATTTARTFGASTCSSVDLPNPSNLAETVTSTATDGWRICGASTDNIGNSSTSGPSNFFGSDAGAPTSRFAGSTPATPALVTPATASVDATANTTIFGIAAQPAFGVVGPTLFTDRWGVEGLDSRSGFNQNLSTLGPAGPAVQSLTILNPGGSTCTGFSPALGTILSDTWVRSTDTPGITCGVANQPGYYDYAATVVDRAGNSSPTVTKNYAVDQAFGPNITGLGFATALYTPGNPAPFGFSANDDLEIIDGTLAVTQVIPSGAGTALRYPLGSLTSLGTRWDAVLTNVLNGQNASIPYFIFRVDETCSAAATPYANCPAPGGPPAYITAPKTTLTTDYTADATALPTNVSANVDDVAWQVAGAPISAPMLNTQFSPNTGIGEPWTAADIVSWDVDVSTATAIATHVASTSIVVPFFTNASLWRLYGTEWVFCIDFPNPPALTDNGAHRFWTYSVTIPTTGACSLGGGGGYRAMGTKGGAGLFTPTR